MRAMTAALWMPPGTGREGLAPVRPGTAVAGLALGAGAAAGICGPTIAAAALALPAAPLLRLAPDLALLAHITALPFDAVASLVEDRTLTLTRVLGIAVLGGWVLHVVARAKRVRLGRPGLLLLAYAAFAGASIGWSNDPDATQEALRTLAQLVLLYAMAANVLDDWGRLARALDVLLLATSALAVLVLVQADATGARAVLHYGTLAYNPNFLAAQLAFPAAAALAVRTRWGPIGWWRLAAVVPIGLALIATGSRGGALACAAGLVVVAVARPRLGGRVLAALALTAVLLPAVLPRDSMVTLRARWATAAEDRLSGRLDIWRVGLAMVADRPLAGTGFAGFRDAFYGYMLETRVDPHFGLLHSRGNRAAHNIYLSTIAELGIAGGVLLGLALATHGRLLWRLRRAAVVAGNRPAEDVALGLLAAFATVLVAGFGTELLLVKTPWLLLGAIQGAGTAAGWKERP